MGNEERNGETTQFPISSLPSLSLLSLLFSLVRLRSNGESITMPIVRGAQGRSTHPLTKSESQRRRLQQQRPPAPALPNPARGREAPRVNPRTMAYFMGVAVSVNAEAKGKETTEKKRPKNAVELTDRRRSASSAFREVVPATQQDQDMRQDELGRTEAELVVTVREMTATHEEEKKKKRSPAPQPIVVVFKRSFPLPPPAMTEEVAAVDPST